MGEIAPQLGVSPIGLYVDASQPRAISPYLATMSIVYAWAPDAMYGVNASVGANDTMAAWARSNNVAAVRYPGGQASYCNWEDPSGIMGQTTRDPTFDQTYARRDGADFMNLGEYLDLCVRMGTVPLVGVNYNDHGDYVFNTIRSGM